MQGNNSLDSEGFAGSIMHKTGQGNAPRVLLDVQHARGVQQAHPCHIYHSPRAAREQRSPARFPVTERHQKVGLVITFLACSQGTHKTGPNMHTTDQKCLRYPHCVPGRPSMLCQSNSPHHPHLGLQLSRRWTPFTSKPDPSGSRNLILSSVQLCSMNKLRHLHPP